MIIIVIQLRVVVGDRMVVAVVMVRVWSPNHGV